MISEALTTVQEPDTSIVTEWQKNWATVTTNPFDFSAWEYLLRIAENANGGITKGSSDEDVDNLRLVFDHMLARFPLCFGYWKKYADWELSLVDTVKAEQIYERGVGAIQNSIDLWNNYISFKIQYYSNEDEQRALFERAAQFCGYDFLSHVFWDKYVEWEEMAGRLDKTLAILERVVHIPLHQYARYFEKYTQISYLRPLNELITEQEIHLLDQKVRLVKNKTTESGEHCPKTDLDYQKDIRELIHEKKSLIYLSTQEAVHKKWPFESLIKRSYFHVKALDDDQLDNWRNYLDYEEEHGDTFVIYTMYERCLVSCANYEEFWSRYVKFLTTVGDIENARNVFLRATQIHIPESRPSITIQFALFEEQNGDIDSASQIFEELTLKHKDNLEVLKRGMYFKLRQSSLEDKSELLGTMVQSAIENTESLGVKGALKAEEAKYAYQVLKDNQKARCLFRAGLLEYPTSKLLCFSFLLFELGQLDDDAIREAWSLIKDGKLDGNAKQQIGRRYIEFLQESGKSVEEFNEAEFWVTSRRNPKVETLKRDREEDEDSKDEEVSESKKMKE